MQEYFSEVIVLDKQPNGDLDSRFSMFTKRYGKLVARAKSARKITSKLSGHLEPGSFSRVRFVEKNGLQVVDALKDSKTEFNPADLRQLNFLLSESEPDPRIWNLLLTGRFQWNKILEILGWDPESASCSSCHNSQPAVFNRENQEFFCKSCSSNLAPDKLIYLEWPQENKQKDIVRPGTKATR